MALGPASDLRDGSEEDQVDSTWGASQRLEHMTWPEVERAIEDNVPLAMTLGSLEQHGPHLPLGTDVLVPYELLRQVAATRRLLVAPPIFFAAYSRPRSGGGRSFPGSTGIRGTTLTAMLEDIIGDFFRQGFRRLAVVNGHFENAAYAYDAIENLTEKYPGSKSLIINWWDQAYGPALDAILPDDFPGWATEHAALTETAILEEFLPGLVHLENKGEGGGARILTYDILPTPSDVIAPSGVLWKSSTASRQIGARLASVVVEHMGNVLDEEFGLRAGQP